MAILRHLRAGAACLQLGLRQEWGLQRRRMEGGIIFAALLCLFQKHKFLFVSQYVNFIHSHVSDAYSYTLNIVFSLILAINQLNAQNLVL